MTETAATGRRRPGPVRSLSRQQVIDTALEIMARDGLDSVSFRTIGMRLGVAHKALYTYVADKDDLLAGMASAALGALDLPGSDDPRPLVEQLVDMFGSMRRQFIANADLFRLRITSPSGQYLAAFDNIWQAVTTLVPDQVRAALLYTTLVDLTVGSAMTTARAIAVAPHVEQAVTQIDPNTHAQARAHVDAMAQVDRDAAFEETVRALLQQTTTPKAK